MFDHTNQRVQKGKPRPQLCTRKALSLQLLFWYLCQQQTSLFYKESCAHSRVDAKGITFWVGGVLLPQVGEFTFLGVTFRSGGRSEGEVICWIGAAVVALARLDKKAAEAESKAFNFSVDLCSSTHLRSRALGHKDFQNPPQGGWAPPPKGEDLGHPERRE